MLLGTIVAQRPHIEHFGETWCSDKIDKHGDEHVDVKTTTMLDRCKTSAKQMLFVAIVAQLSHK